MGKRKLFWLQLWQKITANKQGGFSLIEKIVSLVMASMITTALVGVIVKFIESDQKEAAFIATEKEMQIALKYITEDLREAVYVYEDITPILPYLPDFTTLPELGPNTKPVLIFWKTNPIPQNGFPTACSVAGGFYTPELQEECRLLKTKRNTYSLVVYLQSTDPSNKWLGKSRLIRYDFYKYTNSTKLIKSIGFVDPAKYNNFDNWPKDKDGVNQQTQLPNPTASTNPAQPKPVVLVDFIDSPDRSQFKSASNPELPEPPPSCPNDYERVPSDPLTQNSFFACVRKIANQTGSNQDIMLYLRANAEGRNRLVKTVEYIPTLESQVTLRGVIDKFK